MKSLKSSSTTRERGPERFAATAAGSLATQFTYTVHGQQHTRKDIDGANVATTGYHYDAVGRLTDIAYPSGVSVGYAYVAGQLYNSTVQFNGTETHRVVLDHSITIGRDLSNDIWVGDPKLSRSH